MMCSVLKVCFFTLGLTVVWIIRFMSVYGFLGLEFKINIEQRTQNWSQVNALVCILFFVFIFCLRFWNDQWIARIYVDIHVLSSWLFRAFHVRDWRRIHTDTGISRSAARKTLHGVASATQIPTQGVYKTKYRGLVGHVTNNNKRNGVVNSV